MTRTRRGLGRAATLALVAALACAAPAFADDLSDQWALSDMNAPEAWPISTGAGVTVAIVDSGVDLGHPDLAGRIRSDGYDYIQHDATPQDVLGHGTMVAGEVAALRDGVGVTGLAPDAQILPLRVVGDQRTVANNPDIQSAFDRAAALGVRVVSTSLASAPVTDPALAQQDAQEWDASFAKHPETLYVVPAGNNSVDDDTNPVFPCDSDAPNLICVGALTQTDSVPWYSNWGARTVDLFAPGDSIYSTYKNDDYRRDSGTSYAAPLVAAEAALLFSRVPSLTAAEAKDLILSTVQPLVGPDGPRSVSGGRADAYAALAKAMRDGDGDGVQDVIDSCPTIAAIGSDGCSPPPSPSPTPTPEPTPPPVAPSTSVAPPAPQAPRLVSFVATVAHKTATVKVRPSRSTRVTLRVERKVCGKRCRWSRVLVKAFTASSRGTKVHTRKLKRGTYRVTALLAGAAKPATRTFKVR